MRWTEFPDFEERNLCAFSNMKKSQVKLEVKNLPIMSQSGQNKLGQQRYEPCEPMSAWESQNPEKKPGWARLTQNEPDEHEWKSEPKRDQSEPERPRVSQKEFGSGLKVPCSQLIMHDNEMEIGSLTVKGRLAYKPLQWEEDWLKNTTRGGLADRPRKGGRYWLTELLLQDLAGHVQIHF